MKYNGEDVEFNRHYAHFLHSGFDKNYKNKSPKNHKKQFFGKKNRQIIWQNKKYFIPLQRQKNKKSNEKRSSNTIIRHYSSLAQQGEVSLVYKYMNKKP